MRLLAFKSARLKLILFSILHFLTDGLCAYMIFTRLYPDNPVESFYVFAGYNILAFVTQSPVGMLIDKYNKPKLMLSVSIALMILGYIFGRIWFVSVICIGLSNSLFHVAGGKYISDKSGSDISHLGIFVSTGAIGLALGQKFASIIALPLVFFALLILCGGLIIFSEDGENIESSEVYCDKFDGTYALLLVLGVVLIRSFVGKLVAPDFAMSEYMPLLISVFVALGKAVGGICSKHFGIRPTALVSMIIAAICLTLGTGNEILFIIGIFAFNFTMPITLYLANMLQKGKEGFAFGTLAAVLVPGYFLAMSFSYSVVMRVVTAILCIASMLVILIISKKIKPYDNTLTSDDSH